MMEYQEGRYGLQLFIIISHFQYHIQFKFLLKLTHYESMSLLATVARSSDGVYYRSDGADWNGASCTLNPLLQQSYF